MCTREVFPKEIRIALRYACNKFYALFNRKFSIGWEAFILFRKYFYLFWIQLIFKCFTDWSGRCDRNRIIIDFWYCKVYINFLPFYMLVLALYGCFWLFPLHNCSIKLSTLLRVLCCYLFSWCNLITSWVILPRWLFITWLYGISYLLVFSKCF